MQGARPSEPLLVRRGWLRDHLAESATWSSPGAETARLAVRAVRPAHRRPPRPRRPPRDRRLPTRRELAALVRARDGRCRFPGCSIAARFCDLDHVRPWPTGPTAARNLLTLCRRHHRIKQRPGWRLRLAPDGTATWTDPTGRERTTAPLDALQSLVLTADTVPTSARRRPTSDAAHHGATPDDRHRAHRDAVHDHAAARPRPSSATATRGARSRPTSSSASSTTRTRTASTTLAPPTHRRCTSAADLRAGLARRRARAAMPDAPPF